MNTTGKKGTAAVTGFAGLYKSPANPYLETTDWDWAIDPVGIRVYCRVIASRYGLPVVISENGLGAFDRLEEDGNAGTLNRYKKDSFKWYRNVIRENGIIEDL